MAGEAKVAGRAVLRESSATSDSFATDIAEVVITHLNADGTKLVIESWTVTRGLRITERD